MNNSIFISYSHKDKEDTLLYCEILKSLNIPFFIDDKDINGGVYAKTIMENIRNCEVFILLVSQHSLSSDHVLNEVSNVFERIRCGEKVTILPVFLEKIDQLFKYDMSYYINTMNAVQDFSTDRLLTFENKIRKIYGMAPKSNDIKVFKNTYYNYDYENERNRLELQQKLILDIDLPIYKRITKNKSDLTLLDVGCGLANSISTRIDLLNKTKKVINKVVGLEYDPKTVEEAKKLHPDFSLYQIDVEDDQFEKKLEKICLTENIDSFDVINISLLLLHLENPFKVLSILCRFLKPNGVVFIRDVDDGFTYGYPDNDHLVEKLVGIVEKTETAGYRRSGRRIAFYLKQLDFKFIERANLGMSSRDMDKKQKEAFFDMCVPWIIDDIEQMTKKYPDSREWKNNLEWANKSVELLHERFFEDNYIYNLGTIIYIASDKKM